MPALHKGYNNNKKSLGAVERTIKAYRMFQPGDAVLVGVSGGPDSVALLHMLNTLAPQFSLRLGVAHLNHCLRPKDSDNDAEFVESLAKKLGLPYYTQKENVRKYQRRYKLSIEAAARQVRYTFYYNMAKRHNFNKIA
ncbi:ATP-binding protein, partial [Thermodesulfobacteriota bacterium]